eukprot:CAMPEP_0113390918 /NCGR_PEP_ID=MMETSP0013_2-20120614/10430_1 /TAXON_ID=2843 ORGANISM="Skeletonema costatum, Strain 1716" /NCGR_SAMPLE_ID=MMETSP0013_2 /ASSEMBLY_ACC=CAM_ASM_000158 /LENGTH=192 /DNA_ID=CAMNT_0000274121 /DNA_START=75 /DNA_END=653 /DNA_ORIENTATION=+ /assembly_acc=CAM_ASM_000158
MNLITSILLVFLAAAAIAEAKCNRQLGSNASSKGGKASYSYSSKGGKASYSYSSKGGKASYSYSSKGKSGKGSKSSSKGGKGGKGYSYSMSYPGPVVCGNLKYAECVIYIVEVIETSGVLLFQQQTMSGSPLGEDQDTEQEARDIVEDNRGYVLAGAAQQEQYSRCWTGSGELVDDPVYFPDEPDCGTITLI